MTPCGLTWRQTGACASRMTRMPLFPPLSQRPAFLAIRGVTSSHTQSDAWVLIVCSFESLLRDQLLYRLLYLAQASNLHLTIDRVLTNGQFMWPNVPYGPGQLTADGGVRHAGAPQSSQSTIYSRSRTRHWARPRDTPGARTMTRGSAPRLA